MMLSTICGVPPLTVTVALLLVVPPVPVQASVYVVVAVGETVALPLVPLLPLQPPDAVHELAFVLDHVSVEDWPAAIDVGLAVIETVGLLAAVTVTVALSLVVPPVPVHVRV